VEAMSDVTADHFRRAAADVGENGDNDTLPFDVDVRFIREKQIELSAIAYEYFTDLEALSKENVRNSVNSLEVFSERLLVPTGAAGFRITTKIQPFWNVYLNGLGVAIAEAHEANRSDRAHSYRFVGAGAKLFDPACSWRAFREASIADCEAMGHKAVVVQTDISSFYEHIYHHRIENSINDLFPGGSKVATQVDRFLSKLASGRSFGLPVGGQCSRILAELLLSSVDRRLTDEGITWRRYVDDFVLVTNSQADAYSALATLSHALADYGLTLNRTKTTVLTGKHFCDYVRTQLGGTDDEATKLREIDLHFDPYSDSGVDDYEHLKATVESLEIGTLLDLEINKGQPDTFLIAQIGRTLKFHSPDVALKLCGTLLSPKNLHAFRASWSTIMRGIAAVRAGDAFSEIFDGLDKLLDGVPENSGHLLLAESSCLHYLRAIRFKRTADRGRYVSRLHSATSSQSIKRACVDCWRQWKDRPSFIQIRNKWSAMNPEEQRMLWLAAKEFDDDGRNFQGQEKRSTVKSWSLGIEKDDRPSFAEIFRQWCAL
jgi:Reverse transcriptase (RNA-dependent DNA polymerase)